MKIIWNSQAKWNILYNIYDLRLWTSCTNTILTVKKFVRFLIQPTISSYN